MASIGVNLPWAYDAGTSTQWLGRGGVVAEGGALQYPELGFLFLLSSTS